MCFLLGSHPSSQGSPVVLQASSAVWKVLPSLTPHQRQPPLTAPALHTPKTKPKPGLTERHKRGGGFYLWSKFPQINQSRCVTRGEEERLCEVGSAKLPQCHPLIPSRLPSLHIYLLNEPPSAPPSAPPAPSALHKDREHVGHLLHGEISPESSRQPGTKLTPETPQTIPLGRQEEELSSGRESTAGKTLPSLEG